MILIPLNAKGFPMVQWGNLTESDPAWPKGDGVALVCGQASQIIAIDVDTDDPELKARFEMLAGVSPVKKFGTKGFTAFYKYSGEASYSWKHDGKVICEMMSDKRIVTIPPSYHRVKTDVQYVWLTEHGLGDVELPPLRPGFIPFMDAEYPKPLHTRSYADFPTIMENVDLSDAKDMLSYLSSDIAREDWLQIGMALRDEFGDEARGLWHDWSSKAGKRYNFRDCDSVWRSFNGNGVTIGTLIFHAKDAGWVRTSTAKPEYEVDISYIFKKKDKAKEVAVHGHVAELADWMNRTAWRPQPLLCLSASLVLFGFLKGRKYITSTGAFSNLYAFNIAGSASGKDRPQAAIKQVLKKIDRPDKLIAAPASGTGFVDGLFAANGHGITLIDEMAEYMNAATNKHSGAHQGKVLKYWLEAFTSPATYIEGERRADASKEKVKRIDNPLFCLLGSTNPNSLKLALSGEQIANGLLNRFLFFHSADMPRKRKAREFDADEKIPAHLLTRMQGYLEGISDKYGNMAGLTKVPFTDEAMDYYDIVQDFYEDQKEKVDPNDPRQNLYGRAHEHVARVALILCDDRQITLQDVEVAHSIVSLSVEHALAFTGDIVDTQHEREYIRARDVIKAHGEITWDKLKAKTQFLQSTQRRSAIIEGLQGDGLVVLEDRATGGRPAKVVRWIGL